MGLVQHETIYFEGRVQGVGFRYATLQLAKEFEVTGYVKNMSDGRVILELEGSPAEISAMVQAIEERMYGYVRKIERSSLRREAIFSGFDIR
ncbi:MAG: acylphosphatase [Cephaloticoccus sp.]|nr:acylphosphatase [Cephaloticoccus sp.]MCF7761450.1 acylphosphatase [Cephaloticoccus sp.]